VKTTRPADPSTIVGRAEELADLEAFLDLVVEGPAGLIIEGPPGIGKTLLWRQVQDLARARSWRVLSCRPDQAETKLAYSGLADLLQPVLGDVSDALSDPQRRALDVALLRAEAGGESPDQRAVASGFLSVLRELAADAPVLVAVDDAQWLDAPTRRVIEFAVRRLDPDAVGVAASLRTDGSGSRPRVPWAKRDFPENRNLHLMLGPLTLQEFDLLLRTRLDATLPPPTLRQVHHTAGGNPFFGLEIVRALHRHGWDVKPGAPLPVPPTLTDLVRDRVDALPNETRSLLLLVAALSQPTLSTLLAVADGKGPRSLTRAIDAGVIEVDGDRVAFTHPLLASVVYSSASAGDVRDVHGRLAQVVADDEERARHLALATIGTSEEAAAALERAAGRARDRGAPDAAADLLELSSRLTPPEHGDRSLQRMSEAADNWFEAGNDARAAALLGDVVAAMPSGPERAAILLRLGRVRAYDESDRAAMPIMEQALREAGDDLALTVRIERAMSWISMQEDKPRAAGHARAGLEAANRLGDPSLRALLLSVSAWCDFSLGKGINRELWEQALALEDSVRHLPILMWPSNDYANALMCADEFAQARQLFEALHRHAVERRDESVVPMVLSRLSELAAWDGAWDEAARFADEGYRTAVQSGQEKMQADLLADRAFVDAYRGDVEDARTRAQHGLRLAELAGGAGLTIANLSVLGFLELSLGYAEEALRYLDRALGIVTPLRIEDPGVYRFVPDAIECMIAAGQRTQARELLGPFGEQATRLDRPWALATTARCWGLLMTARGNPEGAVDHFTSALAEHDRLPMPFERGRTLLAMGAVQRRLKQKAAARGYLDEALRVFDGLGAPLWAAKARAELARIGGRAPDSISGLTPTEARIAELVAAGKSNPEIARLLSMSRKTVESNLSRIYAKLAVRNRTELARKMMELAPT
jgi:DNA-binding CsgD family transcriptional regulator